MEQRAYEVAIWYKHFAYRAFFATAVAAVSIMGLLMHGNVTEVAQEVPVP